MEFDGRLLIDGPPGGVEVVEVYLQVDLFTDFDFPVEILVFQILDHESLVSAPTKGRDDIPKIFGFREQVVAERLILGQGAQVVLQIRRKETTVRLLQNR